MGEKWSKERRLKIQMDRLIKKIPNFDLLLYRMVKLVRENPQIDIATLFKKDVRNDLMLLAKVEEDLGYNFYHFKEEFEDEENTPRTEVGQNI